MKVSEDFMNIIKEKAKFSGQLELGNLAISDFDDALRISDAIQGELRSFVVDVNLHNVKWGGKNLVKVFLHAICECEQLRSFRWSESSVDINELDQLDVLLCDTKSLRLLDLTKNGLQTSSVQTIMRPFTVSPNDLSPHASLFSLLSLNLSHNNIGDAGVLIICRSLLQFSRRASSQNLGFNLEELILDDNNLTDKAAFCLAQLLNSKTLQSKSNTKTVKFQLPIEVLSIGENQNITGDGIAALLGDTKVGSISPLVKLCAPRCSPNISILQGITSCLTGGLAPKLEFLDVSFSEADAEKVIQISASNYSKILAPPTSESLSKSLKSLSDTLVISSQPGPSRNGPRLSPSKNRIVLQRMLLGSLPQSMFETCVKALNKGLHGYRQQYEDCLLGLESINPAAKFFGINYVSNIAAWIEEGNFDNRRLMKSPPSVGDRFNSSRSVKAEKSHINRIRDSSPVQARNANLTQDLRPPSPPSHSLQSIVTTDVSAKTEFSTNTVSPTQPKVDTSPKSSSRIEAKQLFQSQIEKSPPRTALASQSVESPSSPTFKQALSMSESLKSAIKDLTDRVKASQLRLESSIQQPKAPDRSNAVSSSGVVNNLGSTESVVARNVIPHVNISEATVSTSTELERKREESKTSVDVIKSIVEETVQKYLSMKPTEETRINSASVSLSPSAAVATITQPNTTEKTSSHFPQTETAATAAYQLSRLNSIEQHNLLDYLNRTRDELRVVLRDISKSNDQKDNIIVSQLEDRLKSVEQLLYFHLRSNNQRQESSPASRDVLTPSTNISHTALTQNRNKYEGIFENNSLARRTISSLVNSAAVAPLTQPHSAQASKSTVDLVNAVQHQRTDEKRLLYFEDIEQRLDLIEHLLQFDQQLQNEQYQLARSVSFQDRTSRWLQDGENPIDHRGIEREDSQFKRVQRRQMIQYIQNLQQPKQILDNPFPMLDTTSYGLPPYTGNPNPALYIGGGVDSYRLDDYADILGYGEQQRQQQRTSSPLYVNVNNANEFTTATTHKSYLNDRSRQYLSTRARREDEVESVYSVPKHQRQAMYTSLSLPPSLPVPTSRTHGKQNPNTPALPFMTPGFFVQPPLPPSSSSSSSAMMSEHNSSTGYRSASTMQDRWRSVTPVVAKTGTTFLTPVRSTNGGGNSVPGSGSVSGAGRAHLSLQNPADLSLDPSYLNNRHVHHTHRPHHFMQSTASSALKSNVHHFHDVHHQHGPHWTPNGIASASHVDNPSPPINKRSHR